MFIHIFKLFISFSFYLSFCTIEYNKEIFVKTSSLTASQIHALNVNRSSVFIPKTTWQTDHQMLDSSIVNHSLHQNDPQIKRYSSSVSTVYPSSYNMAHHERSNIDMNTNTTNAMTFQNSNYSNPYDPSMTMQYPQAKPSYASIAIAKLQEQHGYDIRHHSHESISTLSNTTKENNKVSPPVEEDLPPLHHPYPSHVQPVITQHVNSPTSTLSSNSTLTPVSDCDTVVKEEIGVTPVKPVPPASSKRRKSAIKSGIVLNIGKRY